MRSTALSNPLLSDLGLTHHGMVLVSFVQSVISSFDKHLTPLIETRGQKTREHTDHHLLNKRRVHTSAAAAAMPERSRLPESPLSGLHNPKSEKQIRDSMGQNARR
jgi:hypothetical protein